MKFFLSFILSLALGVLPVYSQSEKVPDSPGNSEWGQQQGKGPKKEQGQATEMNEEATGRIFVVSGKMTGMPIERIDEEIRKIFVENGEETRKTSVQI